MKTMRLLEKFDGAATENNFEISRPDPLAAVASEGDAVNFTTWICRK